MKRILISGATSAIAQATAREMVKESQAVEFVLLGRNAEKLSLLADDLKVRGASQVNTLVADLSDPATMETVTETLWQDFGAVDVALLAQGDLPDQKAIENSWQGIAAAMNLNGLAVIAQMTALATRMEERRAGTIAAIGSVAGDRGRQSNYVYGCAKGAVATYAQGLRNRLVKANVHVLTIKPGFVDTPMTAEFDKGGPLWATPEKVASDIVKGITKKRNTVYTPIFWLGIMTIIKSVPEAIFKKLSL